MKYFDHIRFAGWRGRILVGSLLLACTSLPATARQAAPPAPAAPQKPASAAPAAPVTAAPAARPPQTSSPRAPRVNVTPRVPQRAPGPAPAPVAAPQAPAPVAPPRPAVAPAPPREVVTVVHRLSGWKLLAWLATSGPPALELDKLPSLTDAHTNIVAGYIYEDGRTVVARLPQAEMDFEALAPPATPPGLFAQAGSADAEPEYLLVTSEGKRVEAKFVGLDAATGLTMLEAKERLLSGAPAGDEGDTEDPTVGQRVRLYAPAPAPPAKDAPQPSPGYVYLSIDQKEGLLTQVVHASSGKPARVMVRADVSPQWAGAVAANEVGEVVGIVSQTRDGVTQLVPMATVRSACDRVLKLRGSAPQPWLGVRGDAAFQAPLAEWVSFGWTPELARPLIEKRQGIILRSVAPGTPAALAGLKAGDLITGVGAREVRGVEDLSFTLREAGVGTTVDLTVWRALEAAPLKVSVELKGAKNPALATAFAEQRAAHASLSALAREASRVEAELLSLAGRAHAPSDRAKADELSARLKGLKAELKNGSERMKAAAERVAHARRQADWAGYGLPPVGMPFAAATPLQTLGLNTINLTARGAAQFRAKGGVLVVAVLPESLAAANGLHVGDVIETVNGTPVVHTELRRLLAAPGAPALTFGLVRAGRRLTVNLPPAFGDAPPQP